MKNNIYSFVFISLLCTYSIDSFAYAFSAKNAQGIILYYNYINNGLELELTTGEVDYPTNVAIPEEVTFMNRTRKVTKIGMSAFRGNKMTSIILPKNIQEIGDGAFSQCYFLTSITLHSNLKTIGESAFSNCEKLASISIPSSVCKIGKHAFYMCTTLESIVIPEKIIEIDDDTYKGCSSLISVTIPEGVTIIGDEAFKDCEKLRSITIPSTVKKIGLSAFGGINIESVTVLIKTPFNLPSGAFSENTFHNATLYVPQGSKEAYKKKAWWSKFIFVEEKDLVIPETKESPYTDVSSNHMRKVFLNSTQNPNYSKEQLISIFGERYGTAIAECRLEKGMTKSMIEFLMGNQSNFTKSTSISMSNRNVIKTEKWIYKELIVENEKSHKNLVLYFDEEEKLSDWALE